MKLLFIVNPAAGGKKHDQSETIRKIKNVMRDRTEPYDIYITAGAMDACRRIREAASSGETLRVIACGGDGTLNECVNGAFGFDNVSVTNYPCGTGNDFIKMFGKEDMARFHDLSALLDGFERKLDVIDCNGRTGINICSLGIDARIGTEVHKYSAIPVIGGATGYVVSLAVNICKGINQHLIVRTPNAVYDEEFALVCACNGRYYGGGFNPVPDADPTDGVMDCLLVRNVSRLQFLSKVVKYAGGKYKALGSLVVRENVSELEIEADSELVVNIDGEAIRAKKLSFRLVPSGVNFIFPKDFCFFGSESQNCVKSEA